MRHRPAVRPIPPSFGTDHTITDCLREKYVLAARWMSAFDTASTRSRYSRVNFATSSPPSYMLVRAIASHKLWTPSRANT